MSGLPAITEIDIDLIRVAHKARKMRALPPYVEQHIHEVELLVELARVQIEYALLALGGGRGGQA